MGRLTSTADETAAPPSLLLTVIIVNRMWKKSHAVLVDGRNVVVDGRALYLPDEWIISIGYMYIGKKKYLWSELY